jgi:glyoxylase I family protein
MIPKCMIHVLLFVAIAGFTVSTTGCKTTPKSRARANAGSTVRLEHVGLNVVDPNKAAQWYVDNLGMKVVRKGPAPVNAHFLADSGGNMMLEIYRNPPETVLHYAAMDPLWLHLAFMVEDVEGVRQKLIAAGAKPVGEVATTPAGDKLAMLRDPWGLAIQLCRRAKPMLPLARD